MDQQMKEWTIKMNKLNCFLVIFILSASYRYVESGYCLQSYLCSQSCYEAVKYYEGCGFLGWGRCSAYRSQLKTCYSTCHKQVCCNGYTGSSCNTPICTQSCLSNAYCSYPDTCSCYSGYRLLTDRRTCEDINECATRAAGCQHSCTNTKGSYYCTCNSGYELANGKYCYDINECSRGSHDCDHVCTNTAGSYTCSCNPGFQLDINQRTCSDIDECSTGAADCDGFCMNTYGSYICSCGDGFQLQSDGETCLDVNECLNNNGGCDQTCTDLQGTYRCECRDGYVMSSDDVCTDIDECTNGTSSCSQQCQNTEGSFVCSCALGFELSEDNKTCSDIDDCSEVVCENGATCIDGINSYTCVCQAGFTGDHCQTDINECQTLNGGCQEACINTLGSFYCGCFDGKDIGADGMTCSTDDSVIMDCDSFALGYLPEACFVLPLAVCPSGENHSLQLTSTSRWYRANANPSLFYTLGITFVRINDLSLPVSLQGVEVVLEEGQFQMNHGVTFDPDDGQPYKSPNTPSDCDEVELVEADIFNYISCGAFFRTLLSSLFPSLPDWITFKKASDSVFSVQDSKADLTWGRDIDGTQSCAGAPVLKDSLYSVFRFDSTFNVTVLGKEVRLPKPLSGRKFCVIADICQYSGATMFLMIPEESRDALEAFEIFKSLKEQKGVRILPRGIGLSLDRGISVETEPTAIQLWNGDTLFDYTMFQQGNVWVGGEVTLEGDIWMVEGRLDAFIQVPTTDNLLTSIFYDEWNAYLSAEVVPKLKFQVFGKTYIVNLKRFASGAIHTYMSIGGDERLWCGEESNPPGMFFWFTVHFNLFEGIPVLKNWEISATQAAQPAYGFVTPGDFEPTNINDIFSDEIEFVKAIVHNVTVVVRDTLDNEEIILRNTTLQILEALTGTLAKLQSVLQNDEFSLFEDQKKLFEELWSLVVEVEQYLQQFSRETERNILEAIMDLKSVLLHDISALKQTLSTALNRITGELITFQKPFSSFGLKYRAELVLLGLNLGDYEIEIVSSADSLFRCSRFEQVLKHFEGEDAVRILGRVFETKELNRFLSVAKEKGLGLGGALSKNRDKFAFQLQVFASMIGIKGTADLFITNNGLYFYLEGNVWDIFLAQLDVSAEVGKNWYELSLKVAGRFLAKARKKRQIQTVSDSFQASYLDGLKKAISYVADWADERLSGVQKRLTDAQNAFTKAQDWLEEKKTELRNANTIFDQAVAKLESAKGALEAAKGPFREAIQTLEAAQKKVDNLCTIKECDTICIVPSLKLTVCGSGWFKYPCAKRTGCLVSIQKPICVAANVFCYAVRAAAYVALEAAKLFVRIPMLALDAAKVAVSVAQVLVDKSRVVLEVAERVLDLAKVGMEFAKGVLEAAKLAVEAVRTVLGAVADVLNFVIEYGIQNIIDVRNCGFEIELSTKDLPVFEVFCDVNAFKLGWQKITFWVNFKNILQSIWNAARATIESLMKLIGNVIGRKRREVSFRTSHKVHEMLRVIRSADNTTDAPLYIYQDINLANSTVGFNPNTDTDYENRVLLFQEKCKKTTFIYEFLELAFSSLQSAANQSMQTVMDIESQITELQQFSTANLADNLTLEGAGVSVETAFNDYNLTEADLLDALNQSKHKLADDPLLLAINEAINASIQDLEGELAAIYAVDFRAAWLLDLANVSLAYFNTSECVGFQDCVLYATSILFDVYAYVDIPDIENIQQALLDIELIFIELFQNSTSSIPETASAINNITGYVSYLVETDPFCSQAPYFNSHQKDQVVLIETDVSLLCDASGDPVPTVWWYKDGVLLEDDQKSTLTLFNVSLNETGRYSCIAGNVVANISSEEAYLLVLLHDDDECLANNGGCEYECDNTIGSFRCLCEAGYQLNDDGFTCTDSAGEEESGSVNSIVIGVSVAVGSAVLITVIGLAVYLKLSKVQTTRTRSFDELPRRTSIASIYPVKDVEQPLGPGKTIFNANLFHPEPNPKPIGFNLSPKAETS